MSIIITDGNDCCEKELLNNWAAEYAKRVVAEHREKEIIDHPDGSVTTEKIKDSAVTMNKLGSASVGTDKLVDKCVTNNKLGDKCVTNDKIAENAVNTENVIDKSITEQKLSDEVIEKIGDILSELTVSETDYTQSNGLVSIETDFIDDDKIYMYLCEHDSIKAISELPLGDSNSKLWVPLSGDGLVKNHLYLLKFNSVVGENVIARTFEVVGDFQMGATSEQAVQIEANKTDIAANTANISVNTAEISELKKNIIDEIRYEKEINKISLITDIVYDYNGYYTPDGQIKIQSGLARVSMKDVTNSIIKGKKIKVRFTAKNKTFDYLAFGFFDENEALIDGVAVNQGTEGIIEKYIQVPETYTSIRGSILPEFIEYSTNKNEWETLDITPYQLIDYSKSKDGYELGVAGISANENTVITNYIPVTAGEKIYISASYQPIKYMRLCTYDDKYTKIAFYEYSTLSNPPTEITIAENVKFIRASFSKTYIGKAIIQRNGVGDWKDYGSFSIPNLVVDNSNILTSQNASTWSGKKWVVYGDSISAYNWFTAPATKLGLIVHTAGVGGSKASGDADTSGCSDTRINAFPDDTALVTVMFGANDWSQNVPIGTLPDILKSDDTYDTSTYIGAIATIVQKITSRFPKALIVLMTPSFRVGDANANPQTEPIQSEQTIIQFGDAVKEVGKRFGCPVIDTYAEMGVNILNRQYFMEDLVHPGELMIQRFSSIVYNHFCKYAPLENDYVYAN